MFTLSFHTLKPSESLTRIQKTACAPAPEPLWQIAALAIVEQEPLWQSCRGGYSCKQQKQMFAREPTMVYLATIMVEPF